MEKSFINYNGNDYPCAIIPCPKGHPGPFDEGEELLVASETLYALISDQLDEQTEIGTIARSIDEQVDYYTPDEILEGNEGILAQYLIDYY